MESLSNMIKHSFANIPSIAKIVQNKPSYSASKKESLNPNRAALKEAMYQCRREVKKSTRWHVLPSPICFEHAAMLSRQNKSYQTEIKICQLYISLVDKCIARRSFNKKRLEKRAQSLRQPFISRIDSIEHLNTSNGVDVHHI